MVPSKYLPPIAVKVAIDSRRRMSLPRYLQISAPFILFEVSGGAESWIGICEAGTLTEVSKQVEGIQVLAKYWSQRPAVPATLCQRDGLVPGAALWLVTVGSWVEVWPECRWWAHMDKALVSLY